ncbi:MAG: deoxyguanosinetriphosphate triphosphohydrolase [Candidatus Methylacidiphilales bacterium]
MSLQARYQWEQKEHAFLAPYAQKSCESRGRVHPEAVHVFRSEFQRDRDRIVHSTAFRRLEYKTQVVLNGTGDHYRTRLTHTMEVSSIARTVARTLGLNEDLTEAVALAHDLGHAPFGHPGEHTLNELMRDHGGFEHNRQSLRVVEHLEMKYPEFNGLNLTWEVLEGLSKHDKSRFGVGNQPSLEAQVADASDEIAYCCADLDDALENDLVSMEQLDDINLWKELDSDVSKKYSRLENNRRRRYLVRCLINRLVDDLCRQSAQNITEAQLIDVDSVRTQPRLLIGFSMPIRAEVQNIRDFLTRNFYFNERVAVTNRKACHVLQALYEFFHLHPSQIGEQASLRIKKEGLSRAVCDYLSGMTDSYALKKYARHIGTDSLLQDLLGKKSLDET